MPKRAYCTRTRACVWIALDEVDPSWRLLLYSSVKFRGCLARAGAGKRRNHNDNRPKENNPVRILLLAAFAGASLILSAGAGAAGDAAAGKAKSAVCGACHGADGNSMNPLWPNLAGQQAPYMVKQLKDFKSGARKDPVMAPMAVPLSDQDMENLAAYFASQKQK